MQLLKIQSSTTLAELANAIGSRNVESVLAVNGIKRSPVIGKSFADKCHAITVTTPAIDTRRKMALLNNLTHEADIFEYAALQNENGWKIMSVLGALPEMLRIPDSVELPDSVDVLGNHQAIGNRIYDQAMESLKSTGTVDPGIFNEYTSVKHSQLADTISKSSLDPFQWFHIPWGKVTLHSSLDDESKDFPVYPEELSDNYQSNYTQMPDMLYQYEPWQAYQSSGPRTVDLTFNFHRDMWTGDHRDGKANELIRFCEAHCYPNYSGSSVQTSMSTLYVEGAPFIRGIITGVSPKWSGPIGLDGWYLMCELTLSITEVSASALNYEAMKKKGIIG